MPLTPGDKLGPYEILSPIGAGGMGEVYKARDTRLDRSVAVKVLPQHIAKREDLRARFEREARAVASLNHPNICTLFDIGSQDGTSYMVMELMEGETLAARIEKGPIPLEQALGFAQQIADALDRAHRAGVTHRDVKPANIMLTRDGIKVLDFGLAKSTAALGPNDATIVASLTTEGSIIGTPQYMAPEQFEGKEADARSDIWALGAVLYEMVTGQKAFQGKSYSTLVGAILATDPQPMSVKSFTPAWVERLVRRCLSKDPEGRYFSMHDIVLDLRTPPVESAASAKANHWPWVVAACLAVVLSALAVVRFRESSPELPMRITYILPPDKAEFNETAISPDGKLLAFTATSEGKQQLWVRPLRSLAAQPLAGTERAADPFWSPDSRWIGFFAGGKLKKIEATGGLAQALCDLSATRGGTWNAEGIILFGDESFGLSRISALGGMPSPVTTSNQAKEGLHGSPVFLPGGRRFLYRIAGTKDATAGIYVGSLDTRERTRLVGDTSTPGFSEGHLLVVRQGTLMAQRLDADRGAVFGQPFPVAEKVGRDALRGRERFSVSGNGLLVYESGGGEWSQLTWLDRGGKQLEAVAAPIHGLIHPQFSPDEKQLAFIQTDDQNGDIWTRDMARGISTRFTSDPAFEGYPLWSPDGRRMVFSSNREGPYDLYIKGISGASHEQPLLKTANRKFATSWTADGHLLLYHDVDPITKDDLWVLPMEGERKPSVFLRTTSDEGHGAFSPDGKWIAYQSNESGRFEIYVQPYPATGAKWQVSKDGGNMAAWRRDGKEIYWLEESALMAAEVKSGPVFQPGVPQQLFETGIRKIRNERYAVSGDGKRFLVPLPVMETVAIRPTTVVENWLAVAKR